MNQRWKEKRGRFRPGESIDPSRYRIAAIDDAVARTFILAHHYSGTYPAARRRFGLFALAARDELVGVAVFSHPCSDRVLTRFFRDARHSLELGRFVLLDDVPNNGESWFLARCFDRLRAEGLTGVVSFSDPVPRDTITGERVFNGHIGCIYQACNAIYTGRTQRRTLSLLPDGRVFSDRCKSKIRNREQGWEYSARILQSFGADAVWEHAHGEWLRHWLAIVTRPLRHGGNHRYIWGLTRAVRRMLPRSQAYPKLGQEIIR